MIMFLIGIIIGMVIGILLMFMFYTEKIEMYYDALEDLVSIMKNDKKEVTEKHNDDISLFTYMNK